MGDLGDVSSLSYGERERHYLRSFGGENILDRAAIAPEARAQALGEMLDEVHTMLRHLCLIDKEEKGNG